jgi:hypothetical protein
MEAVVEQAIKEQHISVDHAMLSNLNLIHLDYDRRAAKHNRGIKTSFVLPFFRLKSAIAISISGIYNDMPMIIDLTLVDSRIAANSIGNVLRCFHSLECFEYQHTAWREDNSVTQFIPSHVTDGLDRSKHCLTLLRLSRKGQPGFEYDTHQFEEYEPVKSLTDF